MLCAKCGTQIYNDMNLCEKCGAKDYANKSQSDAGVIVVKEEPDYKSITEFSKPISEGEISKSIGKLRKGAAIPTIIIYIISLAVGLPGVLDPFSKGGAYFNKESYNNALRAIGRAPVNYTQDVFLFAVFMLIFVFAMYALIVFIGKKFINANAKHIRVCYIAVDKTGVNGNMDYHEILQGSWRNLGNRYGALTYRQIVNVEILNQGIVIHANNCRYSCPHLANAREVYEIIKHNLYEYEKRS